MTEPTAGLLAKQREENARRIARAAERRQRLRQALVNPVWLTRLVLAVGLGHLAWLYAWGIGRWPVETAVVTVMWCIAVVRKLGV